MQRYFINMLLLLFLLANPAMSTETLTPINEKLYYEANFSGVNFGKIGIEIDEQADRANITCDITSSGILAWFVKHSSHTTLVATGKDFIYPDRIYESHYKTRKKYRSVKLIYKNGKIIERNIQPPENADKRPEIPDTDINAAYDLMSFLLQMRTEITTARKNGKIDTNSSSIDDVTLATRRDNTAFSSVVDTDSKANRYEFTINAYDGRRITQAYFTISGEATIKIAGQKQRTITVIARRKQLAGFTKGEIEDYDPNEPSLTIYFSNDEKLIPLRMEVPFFMQKIRADLVKTCSKEESCLLGISQ